MGVDIEPDFCRLEAEHQAVAPVVAGIVAVGHDGVQIAGGSLEEEAGPADVALDGLASRAGEVGGEGAVPGAHGGAVAGVVDDGGDDLAGEVVDGQHQHVPVDETVPVMADDDAAVWGGGAAVDVHGAGPATRSDAHGPHAAAGLGHGAGDHGGEGRFRRVR